jgi:hypothetical protein
MGGKMPNRRTKTTQETSTYILGQFRQWLQQADGAHSLAQLFIEEYEKSQIDIGGRTLSNEEKKEVEEYAHNHVREVMEKVFAD